VKQQRFVTEKASEQPSLVGLLHGMFGVGPAKSFSRDSVNTDGITNPPNDTIVSANQEAPSLSVHHRPRSKAIAIERTRSGHESSSSEDQDPCGDLTHSDCNHTDLYDWFTWRMYHRIVDHRQKNPLAPAYYESSRGISAGTSGLSNMVPGSPLTRGNQPSETPPLLEGEVFDLEL
jgi:hypothetical protein